jgi:hypothetical protein
MTDRGLLQSPLKCGRSETPRRPGVANINCSQHIVTRFTEADIEQAFAEVRTKVAAQQDRNARLRALLAQPSKATGAQT